jgi:protein-tyrosine phosphatase
MPWIALEGAVNVRDVGGMPTADGRSTVEKRLLRADNLQGLSGSDVSRLIEEFGLTRVIDLRSVTEVSAEGPGPLAAVASVEHVNHSMIPDERTVNAERPVRDVTGEVVTEVLLAREERFAAPDPDDVVSDHYLGYLDDRPESVIAALQAIADTPGAALVHCAAGKDRTGVVIALTLLAVGVDRAAVVADYAATAERITAVMARLRASRTYAEGVNRMSDQQHTPRATGMERFLDKLDRRHGGVVPWLTERGFDAEDRRQLRRKLLAG